MPFAQTTATGKIARIPNRIKAIQGGTSASKTISILLILIAKAQTDKRPKLTSVVAESIPHLKRGAFRDFRNIMQEHNYWHDSDWSVQDFTYTFETGSKIEFFSVDSPDKLRGARRDRLFMNECNNAPLEAFNQLEVRTREEIYLDWNPTNEFWFYTDILTNDLMDVGHIIITYKDNEALESTIVSSIESRRNNKGWWQVYGEGQLGEVDGKIYSDWKLDLEEIPHEARLERYGLDFGFSNDPCAIVAIYAYNGGYIIDEILHRKGYLNSDISALLSNLPKALICADSAEPKSIEELQIHGLSVIGAAKGQGSVKAGIDYVQTQRITLTKRSVNIKKAYNNYLWKVDKNGVILNEPDHYLSDQMDAIRYGLESLRPRVEDEDPLVADIMSLIY